MQLIELGIGLAKQTGVDLAVVLAGTSFAMAAQCLTNFAVYGPRTEVWSVLFFAVVLILISYSGGNLARVLYQDRLWVPR